MVSPPPTAISSRFLTISSDPMDSSMGIGSVKPKRNPPSHLPQRPRWSDSQIQQIVPHSSPERISRAAPQTLVIHRQPIGGSSPPSGQLLRRSALPRREGRQGSQSLGPRQSFTPRREGGGQIQGGRPHGGRPQGGRAPVDRRLRRRQPRSDEDLEGAGEPAITDEEIENLLDPPENPTQAITYNPRNMDMEELQTDWPNTIASPTGVVASVQQRMSFLARRIPHGWQSPEQLAEDYQQGNLTRFESSKEREKTIEIAKGLAKQRADQLTERKGEVIAAEDMSFVDLTASAEKDELAEKMVRGTYPGLEKQRLPFLDNVVRSLHNNESYHTPEAGKFMKKIYSLLPQTGATKGHQHKSA